MSHRMHSNNRQLVDCVTRKPDLNVRSIMNQVITIAKLCTDHQQVQTLNSYTEETDIVCIQSVINPQGSVI